jgi:hypothetical protein
MCEGDPGRGVDGRADEGHDGSLAPRRPSFLLAGHPTGSPALGCQELCFIGVALRFELRRHGSAALTVGLIAACGSSDRPPQAGTFGQTFGDAGTDAASVFQMQGPTALSCNLGPDGGVCACADQPLLEDPPNLYFVLDRSLSMMDGNKWSTIVSVIANVVIAIGPRARFGAAVFPDPRVDGCAAGIEVFSTTRGDSPAGTAGPVERSFIEQLDSLSPDGSTPMAATFTALAPTILGLPGKTYVILATDGGPNCNPNANCDASGCQDNIENVSIATNVECPPGGPPNCCAPSLEGPEACLDSQPTIAGVRSLADQGVPVYVVGVPGSEPYAALLDQLAIAGNTGRTVGMPASTDGGGAVGVLADDASGDAAEATDASSALDGASEAGSPPTYAEPAYYAVSSGDTAAFTAALSSIAARITGSCTLTLNDTPPDPTKVNVFLDENVIAQAGPDGWTLDGTTVTVLGKSCQMIMTGAVLDVRVVAGCPTRLR